MCQEKRLVSDFSMCQMKHGDTNSHGRRLCDVHMEAQEKEKQRMRDTNQAMMTISRDGFSAKQPVLNVNVKLFCSVCYQEKEVDMNIFWKRDTSNRFAGMTCVSVSCGKARNRVGKWLRRVSDAFDIQSRSG